MELYPAIPGNLRVLDRTKRACAGRSTTAITGCARRSSQGMCFGRGFDSHRLHQYHEKSSVKMQETF